MTVLDWLLVVVGLVAALGWTFARSRMPTALTVVSICACLLVIATIAVEGQQWQLVPWQVLGVLVAALIGLRRWRPGPTRRWQRMTERGFLLIVVVLGAWALLWAFVPGLPAPSGPYQLGTEVFRWTDTSRHEPYGRTSEYRQVVAQAWYPSEATRGHMAPYFEEPGELPGMGGLPEFVFSGDFRNAATHAILDAPVSRARATWPVLIFSPALEVPREMYTALCTQLASRGYVVVALSSAYESAVTELANGEVVESAFPKNPSDEQLYELVKTRAADASFALEELGHLSAVDPHSPLIGRLELAHVGMVGHSIGGAATVQTLAENPKFRVGVNLNGSLWGSQPKERLNRPLLWVESGEGPGPEEKKTREELLAGLQAGGALATITHSLHMSFSDEPGYMTGVGRTLWGNRAGMGRRSLETMATLTADLVAAFVGPQLGVKGGPSLSELASEHGAIELERQIAPASTP